MNVNEKALRSNYWMTPILLVSLALASGCSKDRQTSQTADTSKYVTFEAKQQACERGEVAPCVDVGMAYIRGEGVAKDKQTGLKYLTKACDGKIPKGCFGLGVNLLMQGSGSAEDVIKGVASIKQACDDKYGEACFMLGAMSDGLIKIQGIEPNEELAKSYYQKACNYGHQPGCDAAK